MSKYSKIGLGALLVLVAVLIAINLSNKKEEIAYVRTAELIDQYQGMIEARQKYTSLEQKLQRSLDSLRLDLDATFKYYQRTIDDLSELDRNKTIAILESKRQQYDQFEASMIDVLANHDNELTSAVIDQVNLHIETYGKEHGFDLIIGTTSEGNVLFGTEELDITDDVLTSLNKSYEGY